MHHLILQDPVCIREIHASCVDTKSSTTHEMNYTTLPHIHRHNTSHLQRPGPAGLPRVQRADASCRDRAVPVVAWSKPWALSHKVSPFTPNLGRSERSCCGSCCAERCDRNRNGRGCGTVAVAAAPRFVKPFSGEMWLIWVNFWVNTLSLFG